MKNELFYFLLFCLIIIVTINNANSYSKYQNLCPNTPLINLGILRTSQNSSPIKLTSLKSKYILSLSKEEKENYESMITLKREFSASTDFISRSFSPEKKVYWAGLDHLIVVFFLLSLVPLGCIIFYLFMRFCVGKCTGPTKVSEVTRIYRNTSWVLMIISSVLVFIVFSIILSYSVTITNSIKTTFISANKIVEKKNENIYSDIEKTINKYNSYDLAVPVEGLMKSFKTNIDSYLSKTNERTDQILENEINRQIGMVLLYIYYLLSILLSFIFFFLKIKTAQGLLFILMLLTIPFMLIFEGYNLKFFFYYGDLCDSVNAALYSDEFPVAGQSLGYYYNCFDKDMKAQLYGIRYVLFNIANMAEKNQSQIMAEYDKLNDNILSPQLNCELVYQIIPQIERDLCKDSLDNLYNMLLLISFLIVITLPLAYSMRRFEILIWKKKNEIESMIESLDSIF